MLSERTSGQERFQGTRRDGYGKATGTAALGLISGRGRGKPCPRPLPYPAGTQLPTSEENLKWTFTTRRFQTSASLQNKTQHLPQEHAPNTITA